MGGTHVILGGATDVAALALDALPAVGVKYWLIGKDPDAGKD